MEPTVTDTRRVKDESVGPAAKVSTSTLKPKQQAGAGAKAPHKAKPKRSKKQAAAEQAAIDKALATQLPLELEEPAVVSASDDELEPVDRDDAWCGVCGGMLYAGPSGDVCRQGHGEPPTLTWEQAAQLHYNSSTPFSTAKVAYAMGAEQADVEAYYAELRAAGEKVAKQAVEPKAPPPDRTVEEAGAVQSFRNGAPFEAVERFYGQALGTERLTELYEEYSKGAAVCSWCGEPHSGGPAECPHVARPVVPDFLPADMQAAMSGHGQAQAAAQFDDELHAAEADDARQMQPTFKVGDLVTPVCLIESSSGLVWSPGERLIVRRATPSSAYEVEAAYGGKTLVHGIQIRHFTEAHEARKDPRPQAQVDAACQRWLEFAAANPGTMRPRKSWLELQLAAQPLSAAEYERIGRLWVGALAANVDIETYAMREREVLATVRADILGALKNS